METEIKAIIEKNLPAQVGDVLKQRLAQAEKDADKVKELNTIIQIRDKAMQGLDNQIKDYRAFDDRNLKLEIRENEVSERERNLAIETLKFQLKCETEKTQFSKELAMGLVRNTNYRKNIFDSENQSGYSGPNGQWIQPTPISKSLNETKSQD